VELAAGDVAEAVVQPVERLDGGRRVEERRVGERSLGDVDEQPQPVGDVLVEGALQPLGTATVTEPLPAVV